MTKPFTSYGTEPPKERRRPTDIVRKRFRRGAARVCSDLEYISGERLSDIALAHVKDIVKKYYFQLEQDIISMIHILGKECLTELAYLRFDDITMQMRNELDNVSLYMADREIIENIKNIASNEYDWTRNDMIEFADIYDGEENRGNC